MIANSIAGITGIGVPPLTYSQTVLADNPIGFWLMDQTSGTTLYDNSGNANNATTYNSPTLNQSGPSTALNKSVLFNGTTQYARTSTVSTFNIAPSANWSVEGWFKTSDSGTDTFLHVGGANASSSDTLIMAYLGAGNAKALTADSASNFLIIGSTGTFNNNAWHHMAITAASGGAMTIYVDGTNVASTSTARRTTGNNSFANIGSQVGQYYFNGNVTAVAIYNTTLSSTRVSAHYNAGK